MPNWRDTGDEVEWPSREYLITEEEKKYEEVRKKWPNLHNEPDRCAACMGMPCVCQDPDDYFPFRLAYPLMFKGK